MLAALLLIGLVPFAIGPLFSSDTSGEEDSDAAGAGDTGYDDTSQGGDGTGDLLADDTAAAESVDDADQAEPVDHTLAAEAGSFEVEGFRPGVDRLEIDLTGQTEEVTIDATSDSEGATLTLALESGTMTLNFDGLDSVPMDDVYFTLTDEDTGETEAMSLSEVVAQSGASEATQGGEAEALAPTDPDSDDDGSNAVATSSTAAAASVAATDPDAADDGSGGMDPTDPDAVDDGGSAAMDPTDPDAADDGSGGMEPTDPDAIGEGGLDPVDPDEPDNATPGIGEPGLDPSDPDEPGAGTAGNGEAGLDPTDPDAADGSSASGLDPTDPDAAAADGDGGGAGIDPADPDDAAQTTTVDADGDDLAAALGRDATETDAIDDVIAAVQEAELQWTVGSAGDNSLALADDGADGTGVGSLTVQDGAPIISSDAAIEVAEGGDGNDTVAGGDAAAYLFGGAGDDNMTAGEGATAMFGGEGADVLDAASADNTAYVDGGAGNDTLIFDSADTATGGDGEDTFWLYFDSDADTVAEVTDFSSGTDFLRVSLNPDAGHGSSPAVEVVASEDGADGIVQVDGQTVAILRGAADATASDIFVEVRAEIFA